MASSGLRKMLTVVNISTLGVLELMCPMIFIGIGVGADVMATGYSDDNYLPCGRCLPLNNYVGIYAQLKWLVILCSVMQMLSHL